VVLWISCPYTSPQNGKFKHSLYSINNMIRSLLFQSSIIAHYWIEWLHTTTFLLTHLPTKAISATSPFVALYGVASSYEHLCVFNCTCYPNLSNTSAHKLSTRSSRCAFLGYSTDHKDYLYLDVSTNHIVISRHVAFNETNFPFCATPRLTNDLDIFL
jgi:hypothetical protein